MQGTDREGGEHPCSERQHFLQESAHETAYGGDTDNQQHQQSYAAKQTPAELRRQAAQLAAAGVPRHPEQIQKDHIDLFPLSPLQLSLLQRKLANLNLKLGDLCHEVLVARNRRTAGTA